MIENHNRLFRENSQIIRCGCKFILRRILILILTVTLSIILIGNFMKLVFLINGVIEISIIDNY